MRYARARAVERAADRDERDETNAFRRVALRRLRRQSSAVVGVGGVD
jgi:hypothetical protein